MKIPLVAEQRQKGVHEVGPGPDDRAVEEFAQPRRRVVRARAAAQPWDRDMECGIASCAPGAERRITGAGGVPGECRPPHGAGATSPLPTAGSSTSKERQYI